MIKFNYILNDLALSNLITKCLYSENANYCDKEELENQIKLIQQENQQLKANWNKLREWLKEYEEGSYGLGSYETGLSDGLRDVIKKMQELEQGSDE